MTLTKRQKEVLQKVAEGKTSSDIAKELYISVDTVSEHCQNAMKELGAKTRAHAVAMAIRKGIIILLCAISASGSVTDMRRPPQRVSGGTARIRVNRRKKA